jgi:iron complex transport system substrate-binding protein
VTKPALEEELLVAAGLLSGEAFLDRKEIYRMRTRITAAIGTLLTVATLAACGSSSKASTATVSPTTTTVAGKHPTRIVSLSPTATEILFAIGAGPQVKAVDDQSDYPPNAPRTKLSGYQPNVEAIANEGPDLVVMSDSSVKADLTKLHIRVVVEEAAATLDDTYHQIAELGTETGHTAEAQQLVTSMQQKINAITSSVTNHSAGTYYYEVDNTYYTATSKTFIGALFTRLGLTNIADAADKQGSGYPQLSAEYILAKNPDFVFLADTKCCKQSAATIAARPGWNSLKAVRQHDVVPLDDDIASRWGPRVVDLMQAIATAVNRKQAA